MTNGKQQGESRKELDMKEVQQYLDYKTILLEEMYSLATISLQGITDKAGNPVVKHAMEIAQEFWARGDWYKAVIASLHDVIEDSETITDGHALTRKVEEIKFGTMRVSEVKKNLINKGHDPEQMGISVHAIVDAVVILTRSEGTTYFDYIRSIKVSGNKDAIAVKIADLEHHLENGADIPDSLVSRYEKALDILEK